MDTPGLHPLRLTRLPAAGHIAPQAGPRSHLGDLLVGSLTDLRRPVRFRRQIYPGLARADGVLQFRQRSGAVTVEEWREHLQVQALVTQSPLSQPVRQVLLLLPAEDSRVIRPARLASYDPIRVGPRAEELVNPVEGALVVVLVRALPDEQDQREQVVPESAGLVVHLPVLDLVEMCAFQVLPPAGARQVGRRQSHDQGLPDRLDRFASLVMVINQQQHHLGMKAAGPPPDVDASIVELSRLAVLRKRLTVVVDGQMLDRAQGVVELRATDFVGLAERGLGEEQRQQLQLEEGRVEGECREHPCPYAAPGDCVAKLARQHLHRDGGRAHLSGPLAKLRLRPTSAASLTEAFLTAPLRGG